MKYTKEHEWLRVEGDLLVVGITEHAASALGDVVFVELPEPETQVAEGDEVSVIESVKAASDILAPVDGEIVAVNEKLTDSPSLVNEDPLGAGWFFKMKVDDLSVIDQFMDEDEYKDLIAGRRPPEFCKTPANFLRRKLSKFFEEFCRAVGARRLFIA